MPWLPWRCEAEVQSEVLVVAANARSIGPGPCTGIVFCVATRWTQDLVRGPRRHYDATIGAPWAHHGSTALVGLLRLLSGGRHWKSSATSWHVALACSNGRSTPGHALILWQLTTRMLRLAHRRLLPLVTVLCPSSQTLAARCSTTQAACPAAVASHARVPAPLPAVQLFLQVAGQQSRSATSSAGPLSCSQRRFRGRTRAAQAAPGRLCRPRCHRCNIVPVQPGSRGPQPGPN